MRYNLRRAAFDHTRHHYLQGRRWQLRARQQVLVHSLSRDTFTFTAKLTLTQGRPSTISAFKSP